MGHTSSMLEILPIKQAGEQQVLGRTERTGLLTPPQGLAYLQDMSRGLHPYRLSQCLGGKGHKQATQSNSLQGAVTPSTRSNCSEPCPTRPGAFPGTEHQPALRASCSGVSSPSHSSSHRLRATLVSVQPRSPRPVRQAPPSAPGPAAPPRGRARLPLRPGPGRPPPPRGQWGRRTRSSLSPASPAAAGRPSCEGDIVLRERGRAPQPRTRLPGELRPPPAAAPRSRPLLPPRAAARGLLGSTLAGLLCVCAF